MSARNQPYRMTISLVNEDCRILETCKDLGIAHFKVVDIRSSQKGTTRHLVNMSRQQFDKMPRDSFRVKRQEESGNSTSAWFESKGCDVCKTIVSKGSFLISGRSLDDRTMVYTFVARDIDALRSTFLRLENKGLKPRILDVGKYSQKTKVLTEKQERALHMALRTGFFEYPREIDIVDLSRRLGINPSSLSETLRRGTRRLLEHHFDQ